MIKELEEEKEESQDPEVEFAIAGAVRECGGLEIILSMIQVLHLLFLLFFPYKKGTLSMTGTIQFLRFIIRIFVHKFPVLELN
jgi:E3 ubiquitin-protein ligase UBR4